MYQHYCGTLLDEDDTVLGICPGCLDFLTTFNISLHNYSLDQLVTFLNGNNEVFEDLDTQEDTLVINKEPGDISLDLNPATGTYEAQTEFQTV